jgi:hypothetical protein
MMILRHIFLAAMAVAFACATETAFAQTGGSPPAAAPTSGLPYFAELTPAPGWSFEASPYGWLAGVRTTINSPTLGGGVATTEISIPFSDVLKDLRMAAMFAAEGRYDRFSLITDIMYINLGMNVGGARITSVNPGSGRIVIPLELEASASTGIGTTIWTTAGGYTLAAGPWGNLDAIAGTRFLGVNAQTGYKLTAAIVAPNRTIALSRSGTLSVSGDYWDAIGGVTGRLAIPNTNYFIPYYFDVGTGELPLTWQAFVGVGYRASWADLSLGYRYLDFRNNGSAHVQDLQISGPILAATFRF